MKWVSYSLLILVAWVRLASERELREAAVDWCADRERGHRQAYAVMRGTIGEEAWGRFPFEDPEVRNEKGGWVRFGGSVFLRKGKGLDFGRRVRISGPMRCVPPLRNPGRFQDGLWQWAPPRVNLGGPKQRLVLDGESSAWDHQFRKGFASWLSKVGAKTPGLLAFEKAVWMGDLSGLPESLRDLFREGGMAAILALSGQHVTCLLLAVMSLQKLFFSFFWRWLPQAIKRAYPFWCESLPTLAAGLLVVLSGGAPPIARTFVMAVSVLILRWRRIHCSTLQLTTTTVALLLIWQPWLADSPSFFLSGFGTALTAGVLNETKFTGRLRLYLIGATCLPILAWPLSAFLFAKVSWSAPLHNILLSWLWELWLIPCGFFLPLILGILPVGVGERLGWCCEEAWQRLILLQEWLGRVLPPLYKTCIRPTWLEWVTLESTLVIVFIYLFSKKLFRDATSET